MDATRVHPATWHQESQQPLATDAGAASAATADELAAAVAPTSPLVGPLNTRRIAASEPLGPNAGAHQCGEGSGKLQRIALARKAPPGQRMVDQRGQCRRIALPAARHQGVAAQLDAVAHPQHTRGIDMAMMQPGGFDCLERAQQIFGDFARFPPASSVRSRSTSASVWSKGSITA